MRNPMTLAFLLGFAPGLACSAQPDSVLLVDWPTERVVGEVSAGDESLLREARRRRSADEPGSDKLFLLAAYRARQAANRDLDSQIVQELLANPESAIGAARGRVRLARHALVDADYVTSANQSSLAIALLQSDFANRGSSNWVMTFAELFPDRVAALQYLGQAGAAATEIGDFLRFFGQSLPDPDVHFSLLVTQARLLARAGRLEDSELAWESALAEFPKEALAASADGTTTLGWRLEQARTWDDHGQPVRAVERFAALLVNPANQAHPNYIAGIAQMDRAYGRATRTDELDRLVVDTVRRSASIWTEHATAWYAGPDAPFTARKSSDLTGLGWAILHAGEIALEHHWLDEARELGNAYTTIVESEKPGRGGGRGLIAKADAIERAMQSSP